MPASQSALPPTSDAAGSACDGFAVLRTATPGDERVGLVAEFTDPDDREGRLRMGPLAALEPETGAGYRVVLAAHRATAPVWLTGLPGLGRAEHSPYVGLITNMLRDLADAGQDMEPDDAAVVIESILLLGRKALNRPPPIEAPTGAADDPDILAATRLIDERLMDPDLDAASLMQALGLSRSSLYRAFQAVGGVNAYIRQRRLQLARDVLAARTGPRPTVGEVAQSHGFASDSHFSRAFRAAFGHSPGALRDDDPSG